jgi:NitT/TauT family transport system permease protein
MKQILSVFQPNKAVSSNTLRFVAGFQVLAFLVFWLYLTPNIIPKPLGIFNAWLHLWEEGLGQELYTSFILNLEAMAVATAISLFLAYGTVLAFFRPIVELLSKFRFLGLLGLTFIFTLMVAGANLKIMILVFGISGFLITEFAVIVSSIPKEEFDLARTLRMSEWRIVYEVIILGQADRVFNVIRTNMAIGWTMLTMVEGLVRAEGGLGTLIIVQSKYFKLDAVFAIQITILLVAILQDYLIGVIKGLVCPYANIAMEKK